MRRLAAAGTVLLWASAFPAITVAVRGLGPAGLAVARLALAAPLMGVRRPALRDLPLIALCGLAGMTGYQLLLNAGERVVPAGTASLLVATAPVYASLLAVAFLGERSTARRWAGSAVALAGTALIAAGSAPCSSCPGRGRWCGRSRTQAGRPSARRSSSAWRRRRPGSCCGPTRWRGWT